MNDELVQKYATQLMEHFDTVQIFVSKYDSHTKKTDTYQYGEGHVLARLQQTRDFAVQNEEYERVNQRKYMENQE